MYIVFMSLYILSNGNILYCNCYQEQKKPLLEYHSKYKAFRSYLFRFKEYFIRIKAYRSRFKANQVSDSRISVHFRISDHKNDIICSWKHSFERFWWLSFTNTRCCINVQPLRQIDKLTEIHHNRTYFFAKWNISK